MSSERLVGVLVDAMERGLVPDAIVRAGIRRLCAQRRRELGAADAAAVDAFAKWMRTGPVALVPEKANEQHYELPPAFFDLVLGAHRKYSCCHWPDGVETLGDAEDSALKVTCARAGLGDGMDVLELGCGWGSSTLWMARRYPRTRITAVSNSAPQREFIMDIARREGLDNVRVITADMNEFDIDERFDRVVSIEMFEHMRNYESLLGRVATWLRPDGRLFVHVFAHRHTPYAFETDGTSNWMGRYFFTGGIMPTPDLFGCFGRDMQIDRQWWWDGTHYERTANAWVRNLDARRREVMPILIKTYGRRDARRWFNRWRMFFLACAELFGDGDGTVWGVSHTLLAPAVGEAERTVDPTLADVA